MDVRSASTQSRYLSTCRTAIAFSEELKELKVE